MTHLHLGDPASAWRVWAEASDPPSPALRLTRMAAADLAGLDASTAEDRGRQALKLDPKIGEAWYELATALLEAGRDEETLDACQKGLSLDLSTAQRETLLGIEGYLRRRSR